MNDRRTPASQHFFPPTIASPPSGSADMDVQQPHLVHFRQNSLLPPPISRPPSPGLVNPCCSMPKAPVSYLKKIHLFFWAKAPKSHTNHHSLAFFDLWGSHCASELANKFAGSWLPKILLQRPPFKSKQMAWKEKKVFTASCHHGSASTTTQLLFSPTFFPLPLQSNKFPGRSVGVWDPPLPLSSALG